MTLVLSNEALRELINPSTAIRALRTVYDDLATGDATYIPRVDLFAPSTAPEGVYQWGSMAGASVSYGVLAVRMKSDIVEWRGGVTQEKYCVEPGKYCGLIFVFSLANGELIGILQDGYLQHVRVGAAAAIGVDALARPDAAVLGLLGSGGMAEAYAEAIAAVRRVECINVFSPTVAHRHAFADRMSDRLGIRVRAVDSPKEALSGADIVATATDSMEPTFDPAWLETGTHVTCVTRRELSSDLLARADRIIQLGHASIPRNAPIPMMEWKAGGFAAYVCGADSFRSRIPSVKDEQAGGYPTLVDLRHNPALGRTSRDQVTLFVNVGTQGLQFAAMAGEVFRAHPPADRHIPLSWFLEDIRD